MANFKDRSRESWTGEAKVEHINAGSFQRIADACEVMAQNYVRLQNDRDMYKRWYDIEVSATKKLQRQNAALRGVIKRMKESKPA